MFLRHWFLMGIPIMIRNAAPYPRCLYLSFVQAMAPVALEFFSFISLDGHSDTQNTTLCLVLALDPNT